MLRSILILPLAILTLTSSLKAMDPPSIPEVEKAYVKLDDLWGSVIASRYGQALPPAASLAFSDALNLLSTSYLSETFTHSSDRMIPGREKIIHARGVAIKVAFVPVPMPGGNPYTGIYVDGSKYALMRMSLATAPKDGFITVGVAIKFLRDGQKSQNIFAMHSLDGQPEANPFTHDLVTDVPAPSSSFKNWLLENRFSAALSCVFDQDLNPRALSCDGPAEIDDKYGAVAKAPYSLILRPTDKARNLFANTKDFSSALIGKGEDVILYNLMARQTKDAPEQLLGFIKAQSNFEASRAADEDIFFQHPKAHPTIKGASSCPLSPHTW